MFAIVEIGGVQYKTMVGEKIWAPYMKKLNPGENVEFDKVLLVADGEKVKVGTPIVSGAKVIASVIEHIKGRKIIVFHKRRRKGFHKKQGHRQKYTVIKVEGIEG